MTTALKYLMVGTAGVIVGGVIADKMTDGAVHEAIKNGIDRVKQICSW